jgi:hypothetical protein
MLKLLNWESNRDILYDRVLPSILYISPSEIMKFLPETFEALFNIMHESDAPQNTLKVYAHTLPLPPHNTTPH